MSDEELARIAYAAYGATTDYKNYQGLPMPKWEDLTPLIQKAWCNSAVAVWKHGLEVTMKKVMDL